MYVRAEICNRFVCLLLLLSSSVITFWDGDEGVRGGGGGGGGGGQRGCSKAGKEFWQSCPYVKGTVNLVTSMPNNSLTHLLLYLAASGLKPPIMSWNRYGLELYILHYK